MSDVQGGSASVLDDVTLNTSALSASFAQLYCEHHGIEPSRFSRYVLSRALHWPWRWLGGLCFSLTPAHFECDLELLLHCGNLRSRRELETELREFALDFRNRTFARRYLCVRISTHRLRRIFRDTLRRSGEA